MNMVRYEPWGVLRRFHDDINRVFDDGGLAGYEGDGTRISTSQWAPSVDIKEEQDRFVLLADLPGVEPKDIEITMDNGVLSVKGERTAEERDERNGYRRVERVHGSFHRRFSLPDTVDAERITANGKNGVLEITIPKQEKVQPRRIEVS